MTKRYARTPFGYDGPQITAHQLEELLPGVMNALQVRCGIQPELVLLAWPAVVGQKFSPMTKAVRFEKAVLYVTVKTSTLLSVLSNPSDKHRLIAALRDHVPNVHIENIIFRVG